MKKILVLVAVVYAIAGCADLNLRTREDLRKSGEAPSRSSDGAKPVVVEQAPPPQEDTNSQLRELNGRVDDTQNQNAQLNATILAMKESYGKDKLAADQRMAALEEALKKQETEIQALTEQVNKPKPSAKPLDPASMISAGDDLSGTKKYKEAIVAYQKYRDSYPKGNRYAEVTYKIANCFQELGMKDEARAFYEEVVTKHPKSADAKRAAKKLKALK